MNPAAMEVRAQVFQLEHLPITDSRGVPVGTSPKR